MAPTEPRPFWGWMCKGIGGCLNMMESLLQERVPPSDRQLEILEYQARRAIDLWEDAHRQVLGRPAEPPRPCNVISRTRTFGANDVLDPRITAEASGETQEQGGSDVTSQPS